MTHHARLPDPVFWNGRRVLLTGHTGFKGSWLAAWLRELGAITFGLALPEVPTSPSLWDDLAVPLAEYRGDIVSDGWQELVRSFAPSVVLHLAAQPLVSVGYQQPLRTFDVNVVGTGQLLEALHGLAGVEAVLVITTDKVYDSRQEPPYSEQSFLGGADPYSASKAAAEHLVHSWPASWPLATARAGNVMGGGDWALDRLLPDMVRAWSAGQPVTLRSLAGVRPWQHVLEPLRGYLLHAEALVDRPGDIPRALNFGPADRQAVSVQDLVAYGGQVWNSLDGTVPVPEWQCLDAPSFAERTTLLLDSRLARDSLGWVSILTWQEAVEMTLDWYLRYQSGSHAADLVTTQLDAYRTLVLERTP